MGYLRTLDRYRSLQQQINNKNVITKSSNQETLTSTINHNRKEEVDWNARRIVKPIW